jgi:hypothetical protein
MAETLEQLLSTSGLPVPMQQKIHSAYFEADKPETFNRKLKEFGLDYNTRDKYWQAFRSELLSQEAEAPAAPASGPMGPPETKDTNYLSGFLKTAAGSTVDQIVGGAGSLMKVAGDLVDSEDLKRIGEDYEVLGKQGRKAFTGNLPEVQSTSQIGAAALADPNWWVQSSGEGLGSILGVLGVGGISKKVANGLIKSGRVKGKLANWVLNNADSISGAGYEALMDAAQTYNEGRSKGLDKQTALSAGLANGVSTAALSYLGDKAGIFNPAKMGATKRFFRTGLIEGATEGLQQIPSNIIASVSGADPNRSMLAGVPESVVGGFTGGSVGGPIGGMIANLGSAPAAQQSQQTQQAAPPPTPSPAPAPAATVQPASTQAAPVAPAPPPAAPSQAPATAPPPNPAAPPMAAPAISMAIDPAIVKVIQDTLPPIEAQRYMDLYDIANSGRYNFAQEDQAQQEMQQMEAALTDEQRAILLGQAEVQPLAPPVDLAGGSVPQAGASPASPEGQQAVPGQESAVPVGLPAPQAEQPVQPVPAQPGLEGAGAPESSPQVEAGVGSPEPTGLAARPVGRKGKSFTPTQRVIPYELVLVDADDIRSSFEPGYREELQPRDTDRVGSEGRILQRQGDLTYLGMSPSPEAGNGTPWIDSQGNVITRNHGTEALKRMYRKGAERSERYKQDLIEDAESQGFSPEQIASLKNPIMVRRAIGLTPEQEVEFAKEANIPTVAKMSASEEADILAEKLTGSVWDAYRPSADGKPNIEFVQALMQGLTGEQRSEFETADGEFNNDGIRKFKQAVFAKAYEDSGLLQRIAENPDDNVKRISNGLMLAAPGIAELNDRIDNGQAHQLSIAQDIVDAVNKFSELRKNGQSVQDWLGQTDLLGRPEMLEPLVAMLDQYKNSGSKIQKILDTYVQIAIQQGNPNAPSMFDPGKILSPKEIFDAAIELTTESSDKAKPQEAGNLVGSAEAGSNPVGSSDDANAQRPADPAVAPDVEQSSVSESPGIEGAAAPAVPAEVAQDLQELIQAVAEDLGVPEVKKLAEEKAAAEEEKPKPKKPSTEPPPKRKGGTKYSAPGTAGMMADLWKGDAAKPEESKAETPAEPKAEEPQAAEPSKESILEQLAEDAKTRAAAAKERLKKKLSGNQLNSGIDPQDLLDLADIAVEAMLRHGISFKKWAQPFIEEMGEWVKEHMNAIRDAAEEAYDKLYEAARAKLVRRSTEAKGESDVASRTGETQGNTDAGEVNQGQPAEVPQAVEGSGADAGERESSPDGDAGGQASSLRSEPEEGERRQPEVGEQRSEGNPVTPPPPAKRRKEGDQAQVVTVMKELIPPHDEDLVDPKYTNNPDPMKRMMPHQVQSTALAMKALNDPMRGGFLLADGPGAGKTLNAMAVAEMAAKKGKKVLIISLAQVLKFPKGPARDTDQPQGTFATWSKNWDIPLTRFTGQALEPGKIMLGTYENFHKALKSVDSNTLVVFDEGHALKNVDAGSTRSLVGLDMMRKAGQVLYMSATPADRIGDIQYLATMGVLGSRDIDKTMKNLGFVSYKVKRGVIDPETGELMMRDGKKVTTDTVSYRSPSGKAKETLTRMKNAFKEATQAGSMIKREIPLDNYDVSFDNFELSEDQRDTLDYVEAVYNKHGYVAGKLGAVRDMALRSMLEDMYVPRAVDAAMKEIEAGRKVILFVSTISEKAIGPIVTTRLPNGDTSREKIVVYESPAVPDVLKQALAMNGLDPSKIVELHGKAKDSDGKKQTAESTMKAFNEGDAQILIATLESGGTGLNLDDTTGKSPRTIITVTIPWGATPFIQGLGRIDRLSTKSRAKAVTFASDHRVAQHGLGILANKLVTLGAIVDGVPNEILRQGAEESAGGADDFIDASFDLGDEPQDNSPAKPKKYKKGEFPFEVVYSDQKPDYVTDAQVSDWRDRLDLPAWYFINDKEYIDPRGYLKWMMSDATNVERNAIWERSTRVSKVREKLLLGEIDDIADKLKGSDDLLEWTSNGDSKTIRFRRPYGEVSIMTQRNGRVIEATLLVNRNRMYPAGPTTTTAPPPAKRQ